MKALERIHVIASESDDPHAYRTRLKWCIVGPIMNGDNKTPISCHQIVVRDACASKVASHYYRIKHSIKVSPRNKCSR